MTTQPDATIAIQRTLDDCVEQAKSRNFVFVPRNPLISLKGLSDEQMQAVRSLIEDAYCCGYYHDGYTHDSAYSDMKAKECADVLLAQPPEKDSPTTPPASSELIVRDWFPTSR